jgi:hypothetical protein
MLTASVAGNLIAPCFAGVAQLVEHHLAKVDVESSSLFARSILGVGFEKRSYFETKGPPALSYLG